ncbi:hypothetical protein ACSQ67_025037 [Phaseolus vulgaris]
MITPTTTSMTNQVGLRLMMFMVCVVLKVVNGEHQTTCIPKEREALLQFKAAIVDDYGMLSSWTTPDCCQWEGIRCSNLTAHVLGLHLPAQFHEESVHGEFDDQDEEIIDRYMSGEIHKSLMELRQLEYLDLSSNYFQDSHIPEFLGSLTNLKYLDLSSCGFGGEIPTQLGSLSHLRYLNLGKNSFAGNVPSQLGNLSQLQYLDLGYNSFEGNAPSQFGNLSKLQEFYLGGDICEGLRSYEKEMIGIFGFEDLSVRSDKRFSELPLQSSWKLHQHKLIQGVGHLEMKTLGPAQLGTWNWLQWGQERQDHMTYSNQQP